MRERSGRDKSGFPQKHRSTLREYFIGTTDGGKHLKGVEEREQWWRITSLEEDGNALYEDEGRMGDDGQRLNIFNLLLIYTKCYYRNV